MESIQLVCSIITAVSTIFIAVQIYQNYKENKDGHEEVRRIKTVEIMQDWTTSIKKEASYAEMIVEGFTPEQCRHLYLKEQFSIDVDKAKMICQICPNSSDKCQNCKEGDKHILKGTQLNELRWYVVTYLNMLEIVMTAWDLGIVDCETVKNQFQYLYNPEKGWDALEDFRIAAGGNKAYPNIGKFVQMLKIEYQQSDLTDKKKPI